MRPSSSITELPSLGVAWCHFKQSFYLKKNRVLPLSSAGCMVHRVHHPCTASNSGRVRCAMVLRPSSQSSRNVQGSVRCFCYMSKSMLLEFSRHWALAGPAAAHQRHGL